MRQHLAPRLGHPNPDLAVGVGREHIELERGHAAICRNHERDVSRVTVASRNSRHEQSRTALICDHHRNPIVAHLNRGQRRLFSLGNDELCLDARLGPRNEKSKTQRDEGSESCDHAFALPSPLPRSSPLSRNAGWLAKRPKVACSCCYTSGNPSSRSWPRNQSNPRSCID